MGATRQRVREAEEEDEQQLDGDAAEHRVLHGGQGRYGEDGAREAGGVGRGVVTEGGEHDEGRTAVLQ